MMALLVVECLHVQGHTYSSLCFNICNYLENNRL